MQVRAVAKNVHVSPRKARLVLRELPGKSVGEAMTMLRFTPVPIARDIAKVVQSAAANAENNYGLDTEDLRIVRATVDDAMRLRRFKAKARGRAAPRIRRFSHITVVVEDTEA
ncbi:MAG TPA: 50S ribosomal protein L22 [Dehalococcoidia bacterium]|nr:50S ribosomal protein L22 [Dehalococcoidia bacterium]